MVKNIRQAKNPPSNKSVKKDEVNDEPNKVVAAPAPYPKTVTSFVKESASIQRDNLSDAE